MLLERTDRLHQRRLEAVANAHDLAGRLHLGRQRTLCRDKFIKGKSRQLHDAVVERRLKAGIRLSRNGILNLIERVAQRDLCRNLGDRIPCRLGGKRRRTAHTGIYLDDAVLKACGMQCELHVTAARDLQLTDDIQCRASEHLVFLIAQRLRRCHDDTVTGVHADRIDILHVTYRDAVACAVAHHLILDLFPACDAALHQHFPHTGKTQTVCQDLLQFCLIVGDTAAASAQRIRGTQHDRIADLVGECHTILNIGNDQGCRARLSDLFHRILKFLTILCLLDRGSRSSEELHAMCL